MERVKERVLIAKTALSAFKESVGRSDLSTLERDGAIQRFEFTYETVWKAVQAYLGHTRLMEKWLGEVEVRLE